MFTNIGLQLWLISLLAACIVEDEALNIQNDQGQEQTSLARSSNKQVVGSARTSPNALKVEVSLFESIQPNPVIAKMAKNRGKPGAEKVCRWSKIDNKLKQFTHSIFPEPCAEIVQVAWHPIHEGISLVSLGRSLYAVSGAEALPLPEVYGRPYDLGVDKDDNKFVRTVASNVATTEKNGTFGVEIEGIFFGGGDASGASIYTNYRFTKDDWQLIERQARLANQQPEWNNAWPSIGPSTSSMHPGIHGLNYETANAEQSDRLSKKTSTTLGEGNWVIATTQWGEYAWYMARSQNEQPQLPILHKTDDSWTVLEAIKYKVASGITLQFREHYLLVTRAGARPYVYDMAAKKIAYKSNHSTGVLFWPDFSPAKVEQAPTPNPETAKE
jgi:hypothetical protein